MSSTTLLLFILAYFLLLLVVAYFTSRRSDNASFFIGNKNSNWALVAFGMIGTSLSGVTFVSVPGGVGKDGFAYFQITLGYLLGYLVITYVLLPLYYRLNLTSIYNYLGTRLGWKSYKTGASFFILSRTLGATARLYLVVNILQTLILKDLDIPFWMATVAILIMILVYTFKGGVKTIVYTDMLQTTFMLLGLALCIYFILNKMDYSIPQALSAMRDNKLSQVFFTEPSSKLFFVKQILAGAFITITMTGMDQEMMQKNISVKTLKDAQKNMITISFVMLGVILMFLFLGALLYLYAYNQGATYQAIEEGGKQVTKLMLNGVDITADKLFPAMALHYMPPAFSIIFIIGLISALFPSADGAITALTSSFCIDILGMQRNKNKTEAENKRTRQIVHLSFAFIFLIMVLVFKQINSPSMIGIILKIAGFTYGPLLGLFAFGILTKRKVNDGLVPFICIIAPVVCFFLDKFQKEIFGSFEVGLEMLIINGTLTFLMLMAVSKKMEAGDLNEDINLIGK
jgi:Na+/proline symporter